MWNFCKCHFNVIGVFWSRNVGELKLIHLWFIRTCDVTWYVIICTPTYCRPLVQHIYAHYILSHWSPCIHDCACRELPRHFHYRCYIITYIQSIYAYCILPHNHSAYVTVRVENRHAISNITCILSHTYNTYMHTIHYYIITLCMWLHLWRGWLHSVICNRHTDTWHDSFYMTRSFMTWLMHMNESLDIELGTSHFN